MRTNTWWNCCFIIWTYSDSDEDWKHNCARTEINVKDVMESLGGDTGEGYQRSKGLCRSNVYEGKTHEVNLEVSIGREHLTGWCMKAGGRRVYPQELEV